MPGFSFLQEMEDLTLVVGKTIENPAIPECESIKLTVRAD